MRAIFAAVVNGRYNAPRNYTQRKLDRLKAYYGDRLTIETDTCRLVANVKQAGRSINWVFYIK